MNQRSFKIIASSLLFFFLATPLSAFAQFGGFGGDQGGQDRIDPMSFLLGGVLSGGQGGLGGNQGGGGQGQLGQSLSLIGALTGNMGLLIAGMLTSMLGGLLGGNTPQQGSVDEQYVGQGSGFGSGGSGLQNPYYPTPAPQAQPTVAAQANCAASIFIVKDTTATPNTTKPYPTTATVAKDGCVLALNSDSASHTIDLKRSNASSFVASDRFTTIAGGASHIFRFPEKKTYTLCIDAVSSACTVVTVQ